MEHSFSSGSAFTSSEGETNKCELWFTLGRGIPSSLRSPNDSSSSQCSDLRNIHFFPINSTTTTIYKIIGFIPTVKYQAIFNLLTSPTLTVCDNDITLSEQHQQQQQTEQTILKKLSDFILKNQVIPIISSTLNSHHLLLPLTPTRSSLVSVSDYDHRFKSILVSCESMVGWVEFLDDIKPELTNEEDNSDVKKCKGGIILYDKRIRSPLQAQEDDDSDVNEGGAILFDKCILSPLSSSSSFPSPTLPPKTTMELPRAHEKENISDVEMYEGETIFGNRTELPQAQMKDNSGNPTISPLQERAQEQEMESNINVENQESKTIVDHHTLSQPQQPPPQNNDNNNNNAKKQESKTIVDHPTPSQPQVQPPQPPPQNNDNMILSSPPLPPKTNLSSLYTELLSTKKSLNPKQLLNSVSSFLELAFPKSTSPSNNKLILHQSREIRKEVYKSLARIKREKKKRDSLFIEDGSNDNKTFADDNDENNNSDTNNANHINNNNHQSSSSYDIIAELEIQLLVRIEGFRCFNMYWYDDINKSTGKDKSVVMQL